MRAAPTRTDRQILTLSYSLVSATNHTVYALNCHLQGAPGDVTSLTRVSQLHKALRRLDLRLSNHHHPPKRAKVFIAGDFNSRIEDDPCWFLRKKRLDANHEATTHRHVDDQGHPTEVIEHPFDLVEAYEQFNRVPEFTHVRNGVSSRVDFIWSQGIDVDDVIDVLREGETWASERTGGWPSETRCSDHAALGVRFTLLP